MAESSANVAGERAPEVYMGVDVFGRNTFGGGGWNVGFLSSELILMKLKYIFGTRLACAGCSILWELFFDDISRCEV